MAADKRLAEQLLLAIEYLFVIGPLCEITIRGFLMATKTSAGIWPEVSHIEGTTEERDEYHPYVFCDLALQHLAEMHMPGITLDVTSEQLRNLTSFIYPGFARQVMLLRDCVSKYDRFHWREAMGTQWIESFLPAYNDIKAKCLPGLRLLAKALKETASLMHMFDEEPLEPTEILDRSWRVDLATRKRMMGHTARELAAKSRHVDPRLIEYMLYQSATSVAIYLNPKTRQQRVDAAANQVKRATAQAPKRFSVRVANSKTPLAEVSEPAWAVQNTSLVQCANALEAAASDGNVNELDKYWPLLDNQLLDTIIFDSGKSLLAIAAQNGHTDFVISMIHYGASTEVATLVGNTALQLTAINGYATTALILVRAGSNVNTTEMTGLTPLMQASSNGHTDVVQVLLEYNADANLREPQRGFTCLLFAANYGHAPVVDMLLQLRGAKQVDVNQYTIGAMSTPLYLAASKGHIGVVYALLFTPGISLNFQNSKNETAFASAKAEFERTNNVVFEDICVLIKAEVDKVPLFATLIRRHEADLMKYSSCNRRAPNNVRFTVLQFANQTDFFQTVKSEDSTRMQACFRKSALFEKLYEGALADEATETGVTTAGQRLPSVVFVCIHIMSDHLIYVVPHRPHCLHCGKQDNLGRCAKCEGAFYCSKACQTAHWRVHKQTCSKLISTPEFEPPAAESDVNDLKIRTAQRMIYAHHELTASLRT